ncbi:hypothetical protein KC660_04255 [Candidatus Dojkabacteria bacterium]|uniref:Uncharacterized protein n=1 Tax=Candidatus Dojkabacteria bacterium TaxID=2099670 RepID=A0A955RIP4_9BACT|nr:hypothetical protein [Candidatus Dojkabacteria bacterium]
MVNTADTAFKPTIVERNSTLTFSTELSLPESRTILGGTEYRRTLKGQLCAVAGETIKLVRAKDIVDRSKSRGVAESIAAHPQMQNIIPNRPYTLNVFTSADQIPQVVIIPVKKLKGTKPTDPANKPLFVNGRDLIVHLDHIINDGLDTSGNLRETYQLLITLFDSTPQTNGDPRCIKGNLNNSESK